MKKCENCKEELDLSEEGEGGHIYPDGSALCATCEGVEETECCHSR